MPLTRVLIGIAALIRGVEAHRILDAVLGPGVIQLPLVPGLPRPPQEIVPVLIATWVVLALAFTLGYRVRVTGTLLAFLMASTLLLDQQTYSNHLYLLILLVGIVALAPDPAFLLRSQLSLVYGFSVLWKLNPDYLSGFVISTTLVPALAPWRDAAYMAPLAAATVLTETFLAIAFWSQRWRTVAWVVGLALHGGCALLISPGYHLQIAVFGLEMVAMYTAFGPLPFRAVRPTLIPVSAGDHADR